MIQGVLTRDGACLFVDDGAPGTRFAVLWPYGTSWDEGAQEVVAADGTRIPLGARLSAGGGYGSPEMLERLLDVDALRDRAQACAEGEYRELAHVQHSISTSATVADAATDTTGSSGTPPATSATSAATTTVTSTTQWTPPTITWPTAPFTLPPDYGSDVTCDRSNVQPRPTYPPDAVLPTMEWTIHDLTIRFDPPERFSPDPIPLPAVGDCDRANGLYLLERWFIPDEAAFAGLSVQANPGDESPLLSRTEFSDSITGSNVTWYLWNGNAVRQTGEPANMGLAVLGDYLLMIHGTPDAMREIAENLTIEPTP